MAADERKSDARRMGDGEVREEGPENTAIVGLAPPRAPTERALTGFWCNPRPESDLLGLTGYIL